LLKLPIKAGSIPFVWKSAKENDVRLELSPENAYIVDEDGLRPWLGRLGHGSSGVYQTFKLASCRFGGDSTFDDFHPAVRCFVEALKARGVKPEYERNEDGPNFAFWFDVSSDKNAAYYELATGNHGQAIVTAVFCEKLDSTIVENVQGLDRALYALIKRCGVPTIY